jgi:hypothetical protein
MYSFCNSQISACLSVLLLALVSVGCSQKGRVLRQASTQLLTSNDGIVTIEATATDNVGVTKVEFYVDNSLTCTETRSPYQCKWRVSNASGQTYRLTTKAYDPSGNVGVSSPVIVSVR